MGDIGFFKDEEEDEEEVYIPKSFIVCPECKDEFRHDECPRKEDEKKFCSCKNLEIGFLDSSDGKAARIGGQPGFITVRYKKEYPIFVDKGT